MLYEFLPSIQITLFTLLYQLDLFVFYHQLLLQNLRPVFFYMNLDVTIDLLSRESTKLTTILIALMLFLLLVFYQYNPIFVLNLGYCSQYSISISNSVSSIHTMSVMLQFPA